MAILYFMEVKMTSLIEKIVAIVAPHRCLVCGIEDNILCTGCYASCIVRPDAFCALCGKPSKDWRLCRACSLQSDLGYVWVGAEYQGLPEKLIKAFKFERVREAYRPLSQLLVDSLPYEDWQIIPIPTAPSRVRQRGYDQTLLLASALAAQRNLRLTPLLRRAHDGQQVGSSRQKRLQQAQNALYLTKPQQIRGGRIVLVDDVCTTGATLMSAASLLKQAGAHEINAVVCAWQAPAVQLAYGQRQQINR